MNWLFPSYQSVLLAEVQSDGSLVLCDGNDLPEWIESANDWVFIPDAPSGRLIMTRIQQLKTIARTLTEDANISVEDLK